MAQGLSPLAAGAAGAWIHGECAYRFGGAGLIAEDLIDHVAGVLQTLEALPFLPDRER
jgi:NAD(P)H-hydrate epimerase